VGRYLGGAEIDRGIDVHGCSRATRTVAKAVALAAAALMGISAQALAAGPRATNRVAVTLPVWSTAYAWGSGHGYFGWDGARVASSADKYGLARGLGGHPGLWVWPTGGREYLPGAAEWRYDAPGTTRVASADLTLSYADKLFAHHCLELGLRDGNSSRDTSRWCSPPQPPATQDRLTTSLDDPSGAPRSRELYVREEMPPCKKPSPKACSKWIPALDPLRTGPFAHVIEVHMVLVDDDSPSVAASGPLVDLDGQYINGMNTYPVTVDASDPGAGVERAAVEHMGRGELASSGTGCNATHRVAELGARICPASSRTSMDVDTRALPQGSQALRASAWDPARNQGASSTWTLLVDRTAPPGPAHFAATWDAEAEDGASPAAVSWITDEDPDLPDGTPGSGLAGDQFRYRLRDGMWSAWQDTDEAGFEVPGAVPGDTVTVEARSLDAVGNASPVVTATVLIEEPQAGEDELLDLRVQKAHEFRAEFGIHVPDDVIEAREDDPAYAESRGEFGVSLTAQEISEIVFRERLQDSLSDIDDYAAEHARGSYAGTYVDQQHGALVYVGFTSDVDRHIRELADVFPYPDRLRGFHAERTESEIDDLTDRVTEDIPTLAADGIPVRSVASNDEDNVVEVGVANLTPARATALHDRYGDGVRAIDAGPAETQRLNRYALYRRMNAGLFITGHIGGGSVAGCTIAYSAYKRTSAGIDYFHLTAGHCGTGAWYQGSSKLLSDGDFSEADDARRIGTAKSTAFRSGSFADAELISANRGRTSNAIFLPYHRRTVVGVESIARDEHRGEIVCKSGARTGVSCGVLRSRNYTQYYPDERVRLERQRLATFAADHGDSGAPVYRRRANLEALAAGIVSGNTFEDGREYEVYTNASRVQQQLGITICRKGAVGCGR
jgi:hypothetical protein